MNIRLAKYAEATPGTKQSREIEYLLGLGDSFTTVAYGQLILENTDIFEVEEDLIEEIFEFTIRDISRFALNIHTKPSSSEKQKELSMAMIKAPIPTEERFNKVWETYAFAMKGQYTMSEYPVLTDIWEGVLNTALCACATGILARFSVIYVNSKSLPGRACGFFCGT